MNVELVGHGHSVCHAFSVCHTLSVRQYVITPKSSAVDLELDISNRRKEYNFEGGMFCIFYGILKQHGVFTSTEALNTLEWAQ